MAQRRSSHSRLQIGAPLSTSPPHTLYKTRHSPSSRRRVISLVRRFTKASPVSHASSASSPPSSESHRAVLAPLQFNLRRLPSRLASAGKTSMRVPSNAPVQVGAKRKRVVSGSENAHNSGRLSGNGGRFKRRRGSWSREGSTDDGRDAVTMDVDEEVGDHTEYGQSDDSEGEGHDSSENYLINEAAPRELLRLRKSHLLELYHAAGLSDDIDALTKQDIVDCIVAARDELAELPPSSPPGRDGNSSDYSTDDGNVAGGEETDFGNRRRPGPSALRRRVTVHELGRSPNRPLKGRSLSLGQFPNETSNGDSLKRTLRRGDTYQGSGSVEHAPIGSKSVPLLGLQPQNVAYLFIVCRRRTHSSRSSPTTSTASMSLPSPPATRLRSRKISEESIPGPSKVLQKSKGKAKQVEFSEDVQIASLDEDVLSDLTELSESDQGTVTVSPSPRRLRSGKGKSTKRSRHIEEGVSIRTPPKRKAKERIGSLRESEEDGEGDESADGEEEEVDELVSATSPSPPSSSHARTPVNRRLRPRPVQTLTPPTDGDDADGDDEEEEEEGEEDAVEDGADEEEDDEDEEEEDDVTLVEPRKLRNGKVVGEEDIDAEDLEDVEVSDDSEAAEGGSADEDVDLQAEFDDSKDEDYDTTMDDGTNIFTVDLTIATARSLVRLRRDDLVRLCESRALAVEGTKPQLADALLQWRDRQTEASSPSSVGTVRPPSTTRPRANGRRKHSGSNSPPVLFRSQHVHMDEPRTPPLSPGSRENNEELELDLESLGLEDREIPVDKLLKLEKIGSGGFKDVFIGKFKKRRVAIAEFRGHLTAMDIKELKLLGGFNHPNIVRFLGVSIPEDTRVTPVMIVSELCSNGDLFDYVRNVPPPTLYRVLCMMLDIARGLEYLHLRKPSVIHRDCKSSNILITSKGVAKIADFGLAKVKQSTRSMVRSLVGTVNWQAPELWHAHPKYNHKVDVFACGMVYWEMLQWHLPNKKYPWEGMNEHAIYEIVGAKRQRPSTSGLRKQWCPEILDLIERMWAHEHQDRLTMSEVVAELGVLVQSYR
ncbi:hypothetical protein FA95DRAFT_1480179 [Auriscalpium vulgare]|uniref:Uncharacterized protein n=1 Tax=Auriscalpium vulgare TaxID=40419 RepID=A0ACB8SC08_9AGAM|nr:hypothetical protein FA95DRAFT_1480179 [Auriscalpium vulgare]